MIFIIYGFIGGYAEIINSTYNTYLKSKENNTVLNDIKLLLVQQSQKQEKQIAKQEEYIAKLEELLSNKSSNVEENEVGETQVEKGPTKEEIEEALKF